MDHSNVNPGNAVGSQWGASDLLDAQKAIDNLEDKSIATLTGGPPNPPKDVSDYYPRDWSSSGDMLVAGFLIGCAYTGIVLAWKEIVKSRG